MTTQTVSVTAPFLTVSVDGRLVYAAPLSSRSVCTLEMAKSCAVSISTGSKITFAVVGGASTVLIDSIGVVPTAVDGSCIAAAPPMQPSSPPSPPHPPMDVVQMPPPPAVIPQSPPPGRPAPGSLVIRYLNAQGVMSATYTLPSSGAFLGRSFALQIASTASQSLPTIYLSVLVMRDWSVEIPASTVTESRPVLSDSFCGMQDAGAVSYLLDDPTAAFSMLFGPSMPFDVASFDIANTIGTLVSNSVGKPLNASGLVTANRTSAWSLNVAGGPALYVSFKNSSIVGKSARVCAVVGMAPMAGRRLMQNIVMVVDSGTIPLTLPPSPPPPLPPPIAISYDSNGNPITISPPSPPPPVYRGFYSPPPSPPSPPPPPPPPPPKSPRPPSPPAVTVVNVNVTSLTFRSAASYANVYDNNAFRCRQPSTQLSVNQSHVTMIITYYGEVIDDTPGAFNYGRSQFTYATFDPQLAAAPLWSADSTRTIQHAFDTVTTSDPYFYKGGCDITAVSGENRTTFRFITSLYLHQYIHHTPIPISQGTCLKSPTPHPETGFLAWRRRVSLAQPFRRRGVCIRRC